MYMETASSSRICKTYSIMVVVYCDLKCFEISSE